METVETKETDLAVLKPFDIQKSGLQSFIKDYENLVVTEETLEESKKIRLLIREQRYAIQNILKDNKAVLNKIKDSQEEMAEELIGIIKPTEDKIDSGIKAIENKKAEEKARKDREEQERIEARRKALYSLGMTWNGSEFILEGRKVSDLIVRELSDDKFSELLSEVQSDADALKAKREADEKQRKEAEEKLLLQKQEQEIIAKEQAEKEAALQAEKDRLEKEKQDLRRKTIEARQNILRSHGMILHPSGLLTFKSLSVDLADIENKSEEEFQLLVDGVKPQIAELKDQEAKEQAEKARLESEAKQKREAEEKARQEALKPDFEKLREFANVTLQNIPMPALTTGHGIKILTEASGMITKVQQYINKEVSSL